MFFSKFCRKILYLARISGINRPAFASLPLPYRVAVWVIFVVLQGKVVFCSLGDFCSATGKGGLGGICYEEVSLQMHFNLKANVTSSWRTF